MKNVPLINGYMDNGDGASFSLIPFLFGSMFIDSIQSSSTRLKYNSFLWNLNRSIEK